MSSSRNLQHIRNRKSNFRPMSLLDSEPFKVRRLLTCEGRLRVPDEDGKPPGLPLTGGDNSQPSSARKRPRNNVNVEENSTFKRARSESIAGSSQGESLVVKLHSGEQAVGRLADIEKVPSTYSFQPINGELTQEPLELPRAHGFNPVNAAPPPIAAAASAPNGMAHSMDSLPFSKPSPAASSQQPSSSAPNSNRMLPSVPVPPHQRPLPSLTGFPGSHESAADGPRNENQRDDRRQSDPRNYESPYGQHHPAFQGQKPEQFRSGFQPVNASSPGGTRPPVLQLPSHAHTLPAHTLQNPFRTFPSGPANSPPAFGAPRLEGQPLPTTFNTVRPSHVPLPEPVLSALGLQGPRPQSRSKQAPRRPSPSGHRRPSMAPSLPPMELAADRREAMPHSHVATPDPLDHDAVYFEDVLGDLATCPVIFKLKEELGPKMPRHRLDKLKKLLVDYPDARFELEALERRARMPSEQNEAERLPPPGWIQNPVGVWVPGAHAQQQQPQPQPPHMYSQPHSFGRDAALTPRPTPGPPAHQKSDAPSTPQVKDEHHDLPSGRSLDNILVEINWNRNLDYSDHVEMQEFDTVQKLFDMVEEARPDELLRDRDVIKEIRIKSKTELHGPGGQVLPRIVHDETRGRASVKQLIRKLRSQPPDMEIELVFDVMWKPGEAK